MRYCSRRSSGQHGRMDTTLSARIAALEEEVTDLRALSILQAKSLDALRAMADSILTNLLNGAVLHPTAYQDQYRRSLIENTEQTLAAVADTHPAIAARLRTTLEGILGPVHSGDVS